MFELTTQYSWPLSHLKTEAWHIRSKFKYLIHKGMLCLQRIVSRGHGRPCLLHVTNVKIVQFFTTSFSSVKCKIWGNAFICQKVQQSCAPERNCKFVQLLELCQKKDRDPTFRASFQPIMSFFIHHLTSDPIYQIWPNGKHQKGGFDVGSRFYPKRKPGSFLD